MQFFHSSDLTGAYWILTVSRFMESDTCVKSLMNFVTVETEIVQEVVVYLDYVAWIKQISSSICWQSVANSANVLGSLWSMSWILTSFNTFHYRALILAVLFHSSSLIRSKNSEKKLVNSWFLCQRLSSFVTALCLQLALL